MMSVLTVSSAFNLSVPQFSSDSLSAGFTLILDPSIVNLVQFWYEYYFGRTYLVQHRFFTDARLT